MKDEDQTMRAWTQDRYGSADAVRMRQVEAPTPGRGEVLLAVRATALNAADRHIMRGDPYLLRAAFGLRRPRVPVRGMDVAGTVTAVGQGVDSALLGTEVVGELPGGGLAEYAVAPVERLVPRPQSVASTVAATLPMAGGTAWQALRRANVSAGDRVLVTGASGGVGTFAVQLAADAGAEVWALCGEPSRALVESLGATRSFDYRATAVRTLPAGQFDAVIDIAGAPPLRDLRRLLRPGGSAVLVGGEGGSVLGPIGRILRAMLLSVGSKRPCRPLAAAAKPEILAELLGLVEAGRVTPVIERTWPLAEAAEALARIDSGRTVGKVVVRGD